MKPTQEQVLGWWREVFGDGSPGGLTEKFAALAYAAGQASKVPEGWKLVPVVPTFEMTEAVEIKDDQGNWIQVETCSDIYRAMIAEAPSPKGGKS